MIIEAMASSKVTGRAAPISEDTGVRDESEMPRLPVSTASSHDPNCCRKRLTDPVVVVERHELARG